MAKVRLETGQVLNFEGDPTQAQIEDAIRQVTGQGRDSGEEKQLPTKATPDQYMSMGERLQTGFAFDPRKKVEQLRQERGVAPGTPLEPTGFNLANLLDVPGDIADMIGPAFPAIGQFFGNLVGGSSALIAGQLGPQAATPEEIVTVPAAVAAGGTIGAGVGETVRQFIGNALNLDNPSKIDRVKKVAFETGMGLAGEGVAYGFTKLLNATKSGIVKAANNLLKTENVDNFAVGASKIMRNMQSEETRYALQSLRKGDRSVLSTSFGDKQFAPNFVNKILFGDDNDLAKQVFKLTRKPEGREYFKSFFRDNLGMSDDVFDVVVSKGGSIINKDSSSNILNMGKTIGSKLDDLFTKTGEDLGKARYKLSSLAGAHEVTEPLTQINTMLAKELTNVGFLTHEGGTLFSINPAFVSTNTGAAQSKMFGQLVSRFFGKSGDDALTLAAKRGDINAIKQLANKGKGKALFDVTKKSNFKDFINELKTIDVQISGNEFKQVGKLSPVLTEYLQGLRNITTQVADMVGNTEVKSLTNAFSELAEGATPIRAALRLKGNNRTIAIERVLNKMANPKTTAATQEAGEAFNSFIKKNLDIDFIDKLRTYNAAKEIKFLSNPMNTMGKRNRLVSTMKNAFAENVNISTYENTIDNFLPDSLKIALNAKRHTTARALTEDAISILKARFLGNVMPGASVGGLAAGRQGAMIGGAGSLGAGFVLQNPRILKSLLSKSAKYGGKTIAKPVKKGVAKGAGLTITQLFRAIADQSR